MAEQVFPDVSGFRIGTSFFDVFLCQGVLSWSRIARRSKNRTRFWFSVPLSDLFMVHTRMGNCNSQDFIHIFIFVKPFQAPNCSAGQSRVDLGLEPKRHLRGRSQTAWLGSVLKSHV